MPGPLTLVSQPGFFVAAFLHQSVLFSTNPFFSFFMKTPLTLSWPGAIARTLGSLALVTGIGWITPAIGQNFRLAVAAESLLTGHNTLQAQNTGCGQSNDGSKLLQVMTWDGIKPSFGWNYSGTTTGFQALEAAAQGLKVTDPDIVSYYVSGKYFMVAVYLVDNGSGINRAFYEEQAYDPSTNTWVVITPPVSIDNGTGQGCSSPNIDVDRVSGDAVMVFEEGKSIFANALNIPSNNLYGPQLIADGTGAFIRRQPDVAVYEDGGGTLPIIVSVTYISEYTGSPNTVQVDLVQPTLLNVQGTGPIPSPISPIPFGPVPASQVLELPRIAAPFFPIGNASRTDCMIAVRNNSGSGDEIHTLTRYAAVAPGTTINNIVNAPLTSSYSKANSRPVVTYIGDGGFVGWQYDDANFGKLNKNLDVIGTWVDLSGRPLTYFNNDLLVANKQVKGNQVVPSVEGRNGLNVSNALAMWFDEYQSDIA